MNRERIEGDWKQVKGTVRDHWELLSDEHVDRVAGNRQQLVGSIQESYGMALEDAERQVTAWEMRNAFLVNGNERH